MKLESNMAVALAVVKAIRSIRDEFEFSKNERLKGRFLSKFLNEWNLYANDYVFLIKGA